MLLRPLHVLPHLHHLSDFGQRVLMLDRYVVGICCHGLHHPQIVLRGLAGYEVFHGLPSGTVKSSTDHRTALHPVHRVARTHRVIVPWASAARTMCALAMESTHTEQHDAFKLMAMVKEWEEEPL